MSEIKRWAGNFTTDMSLYDDELTQLADFCVRHKNVYIFGDGKIGKALRHYLNESDIPVADFVISATFNEFRKRYIKGEAGLVMGLSDQYYPEVIPLLAGFIDDSDVFSLSASKREQIGDNLSIDFIKKNFWLNIFVTNRCNLNCRSCSTFAPICPPDDYELNEFKRDLSRIKFLGLAFISVIKFTGGEPFLHPCLFDMFEYARREFPDTPIECYTNGLLPLKLGNDKLDKLADLKITLAITEYPLPGLDLGVFYNKASERSVNYEVIYKEQQKYFSKRPLNFHRDTPKYMFFNCPRYKSCDSLFLFKGGLYKCVYALANGYVNQAFKTSFELMESDFLDIYKTGPDQIYKYCTCRIPYCGYCKPVVELVPWGLSERKIDEWL